MENISKICKELNDFFGGSVDQQHMVDVLLNKLEAHIKTTYGVPDWTGEYIWALHLAKHIQSMPLTKIKTEWIMEQIHKEALHEILDDPIDQHVLVQAIQPNQG